MASSKSAEEVRADLIATMGRELGELFHRLSNELTWLCWRWHEYVELFGKSPARLDILNHAARLFFVVVQETLWFETLLGISRLAGPSKSAGRENLSVRRLLPLIESSALRDEVGSLLKELNTASAFAMEWRNKYIAHRDFDHAMGQATRPLPAASRTEVERAVKALAAVLNAVERDYRNSTTVYDLIAPAQGAESLLYVLRDGLRLEQLRQEKLERGEYDPDDWHDTAQAL